MGTNCANGRREGASAGRDSSLQQGLAAGGGADAATHFRLARPKYTPIY